MYSLSCLCLTKMHKPISLLDISTQLPSSIWLKDEKSFKVFVFAMPCNLNLQTCRPTCSHVNGLSYIMEPVTGLIFIYTVKTTMQLFLEDLTYQQPKTGLIRVFVSY